VRLAGVIVVCTVILMGGDLHRLRGHAHPVSAHLILHGMPLGMRFAFTMRLEPARARGWDRRRSAQTRVGLEKVEADDPLLAKGIRYVADGYETDFIRANFERDPRQLPHLFGRRAEDLSRHRRLRAGLWMIGTLIGMVQMFANLPIRLSPGPSWRARCSRPSTARRWRTCSACRSLTNYT
jgi:chemotaxis protein MotA